MHVIHKWSNHAVAVDAATPRTSEFPLKYRLVSKTETNSVVFAEEELATVKTLLARLTMGVRDYRHNVAIVRRNTNGVESVTEVNALSVEHEMVPDIRLKNGDLFVIEKPDRGLR